ncbi:DUF1570 domain-containing protein [Pseudoalteromonas sp. CR1]|uniref:DUF1570 domain-containing protein n=1 Tax=Pseudoalteromonas sp. CR1 TaxID=2861964 RepID=UPI001C5E0F24|nr:DUF1570 domain-containing protein [Pseudoalteromonas sp. CR1]MBW4966685.1 DUF1570 domain-containing protein [Pseudoalteromonas sp. CR1]
MKIKTRHVVLLAVILLILHFFYKPNTAVIVVNNDTHKAQSAESYTHVYTTETVNNKRVGNVANKAKAQPKAAPVQQNSCELVHDPEELEYAQSELSQLNDNLDFTSETFDIGPYTSVKLITPNVNSDYHKTLRIRLFEAYEKYQNLFGLYPDKPILMNLVVLPNHYYDDYVSRFGALPSNNAGIYFGKNNTALVRFDPADPQGSLRVAIHEAMHVINFNLIGSTPRWLNEGIAEVFENTLIYKTNRAIAIPTKRVRRTYMEFRSLIDSESLWEQQSYRGDLYANANNWVAFFIQHKHGRRLLKAIVQGEAKNPCNTLENEVILNALSTYFIDYEQAYLVWFKASQQVKGEFIPVY